MRTFIVREASDLEAVTARLMDRPSHAGATLDRIKELNPHADLRRLKVGTVLILPDDPGLKRNDHDARPLGSWALHEFSESTAAAFDAAAGRVNNRAESAAAERSELAASLKSRMLKRQIEGDAAFRGQVAEIATSSADEQKALKQAAGAVETLRKAFTEEMDAVRKLLT